MPFNEFMCEKANNATKDTKYSFVVKIKDNGFTNVFIDSLDNTGYTYKIEGNNIFVVKSNDDETLTSFQETIFDDLLDRFSNQDDKIIKMVGSDNPTDFINYKFNIDFSVN